MNIKVIDARTELHGCGFFAYRRTGLVCMDDMQVTYPQDNRSTPRLNTNNGDHRPNQFAEKT
jgi:hypothetical protein